MKFLDQLKQLNQDGKTPLSDYGGWLFGIHDAYNDSSDKPTTAMETFNDVHTVWPDATENDLFMALDNLYTKQKNDKNEEITVKAFTQDEIDRAMFAHYAQPDIHLSIPAILPHDSPTDGERWYNTDVIIDNDVSVSVKYVSGKWTANPATGMVDADGNSSFVAKEGYSMPGANEGALIGRIVNNDGASAPFLIGNANEVPNLANGYLELGINDDLHGRYGEGFADNEGEIEVAIHIIHN